jgi:hypothetical protein
MKKIISLFCFLLSIVVKSQDYQWTSVFDGADTDYARYLATDNSGNIYVIGSFEGTVDFDPGSGTDNHTSNGSDADAFVVKLDNNGDLSWAKTFGGTDYDYAYSVVTDAFGNVYVCGTFTGTTDLNPSSSTASFTSNGVYDVFVVKLNSSGTYQWGKTFGGTATDYVRVMSIDGSSNIYLAGYFDDTVDFDPGSSTDNHTSNGSTDVFISKLNSSGTFQWAETFGGSSGDKAYSLALDASSNVYVTGSFSGTVDFNSGSGTDNHASEGSTDIFVQKFNSSGTFQWAKTFGGTAADYGISIDVDASTHLLVTGYFDDTVDFDPGSAIDNHTSSVDDDVFVQKLDVDGNFVWAQSFGGTKDDQPLAICTDALHNIYIAGFFKGTADFDPGSATASYTSNGGSNDDGYVLKLDENGNYYWAGVIGASNSDYTTFVMIDASNDIYSCGHYKNTVDFDPSSNTDSYTSNSGYADVYISKFSACQNSSASVSAIACDSYTSPSGNYTWTSSGTYNDTIKSVFGCDSIITLILTVVAIDDSVMQIGNSLSAFLSGVQYQWVNCDSSFDEISGETSQSFEPSVSGNYAVIITNNSCSDTSDCFEITLSAIIEKEADAHFNLYPNPNQGIFTLTSITADNIMIQITNVAGEKIYERKFCCDKNLEINFEGMSGVYFVNVENEKHQKKIFKMLNQAE